LDPLATGLLIICTGKATKEINRFMGLEKEYVATLKLGATTASFDGEKPEDAWFPTHHINRAYLDEVLPAFRGEIWQVPPIFSALKLDGKPLYELARKGKAPELAPRQVTIHSLEVVSFFGQELVIKVVCSKGTYIRSLAHDIGQALQSGAYLSGLRRTRIGPFTADEALGPQQWDEVLAQ
jgi:tRNA pseudouridine55 synthase